MKCSNCGQPDEDHCKVHLIPCCPSKCIGKLPRSDKQKLIELCESLKLTLLEKVNYSPSDHQYYIMDDFDRDDVPLATSVVVLGAGEGYCTFAVDFYFDKDDKVISHAVYE